jgi:hypothetical protein
MAGGGWKMSGWVVVAFFFITQRSRSWGGGHGEVFWSFEFYAFFVVNWVLWLCASGASSLFFLSFVQ